MAITDPFDGLGLYQLNDKPLVSYNRSHLHAYSVEIVQKMYMEKIQSVFMTIDFADVRPSTPSPQKLAYERLAAGHEIDVVTGEIVP